MLISQNSSSATHYFLQDAQNSTVALTDAGTGDVYQSYSYNAFGELQGNLNPLSIATNYLYTGQQFDPIYTELYSLRARYYDPGMGRFLTRDTWAYDLGSPVELNRYAYAQNNPATYVDPSGHFLLNYAKQIQERYKANVILQDFIVKPAIGGALSALAGVAIGTLAAITVKAAITAFPNYLDGSFSREFANHFEATLSSSTFMWMSAVSLLGGAVAGIFARFQEVNAVDAIRPYVNGVITQMENKRYKAVQSLSQRAMQVLPQILERMGNQIVKGVTAISGFTYALNMIIAALGGDYSVKNRILEIISDGVIALLGTIGTAILVHSSVKAEGFLYKLARRDIEIGIAKWKVTIRGSIIAGAIPDGLVATLTNVSDAAIGS